MSTISSRTLFDVIGEKAFAFGFIFSLVSTFFTVALVSAGVDPGEISRFFLPMSWFYDTIQRMQSQLPQDQVTSTVAVTMVTAAVATMTAQFVVSLVTSFLALVEIIASIIPQQLSFLVPPLYFFGGVLQFILWVYVINRILELLTRINPF